MQTAVRANQEYRRIRAEAVTGALGAEISAIDLAADLDQETVSEIRSALLQHRVIFFRDQRLDPAGLAAFGRRFGQLNRHPYVKPMDENPDVFAIVKEPDDRHHFGNGWHSDLAYTDKPALATLLYGVEIPAFGGDTLFANMTMAYETLSPELKRVVDGLVGINTNGRTYGPEAQRFKSGVKSMAVAQQAQVTNVEHPVVRTHPETGRKSLFINPIHTIGFRGMSEAESRPILDLLFAHAAKPEHTCRFRWRNGSVAFWDNRCTLHYAVDDFAGQRRVMHRVTLEGDRPF